MVNPHCHDTRASPKRRRTGRSTVLDADACPPAVWRGAVDVDGLSDVKHPACERTEQTGGEPKGRVRRDATAQPRTTRTPSPAAAWGICRHHVVDMHGWDSWVRAIRRAVDFAMEHCWDDTPPWKLLDVPSGL